MKSARYILTGFIIAGLLVAAVLLFKKNNPGSASARISAQDSKSKGPQNAPIQIVEYSDFQCPACARAEISIEKVLTDPDFSGKIHFTYRHFPLSGHRWSGLAHQAAECANEQGRFWDYHHKLYDQQSVWSAMENPTETLIHYAKDLDLTMEKFGFCLASPEIRHRIMQEKTKGENLQIRSTPTFFINGERLVGPVELEMRGPDIIRKILGLELKPAAPVVPPVPALAASPAAAAPEPIVSPSPAAPVLTPAPDLSPSPAAA